MNFLYYLNRDKIFKKEGVHKNDKFFLHIIKFNGFKKKEV